MKATLCIVVAACLSLLVACGSSPQSLIVGKWEVENAPMKMTAEFKADGTASINMFGQTLRGTDKLTDDELEAMATTLCNKTQLGRLTHPEIVTVLRFMEGEGMMIDPHGGTTVCKTRALDRFEEGGHGVLGERTCPLQEILVRHQVQPVSSQRLR